MALYHVHVHVIGTGKSRTGAAGFSAYLQREDRDQTAQMARYVRREGWSTDDLVAKGEGALPTWAPSATLFFMAADLYERKGGTVARCFEIALPRELSPDQRLDLAADLRAAFFDQYPHVWAVHNPIDPDGGEHLHLHLMLSERREVDGLARPPDLYFRQAAGPRQDPATHGVRKNRRWQGPVRLVCLRAGIATLINASLERAGLEVAVTHESLKTQMSPRAPAVYTHKADKTRVEALRAELQREDYPHENRINVAMWHFQKGQEGITDVSREAVVERVRDRFWGTDKRPGHAHEQTTERTRGNEQAYAAGQGEAGTSLEQDLAALLATLGLEDGSLESGVRVRLWGQENERDPGKQRGMSW
jgi:hypothetical protein